MIINVEKDAIVSAINDLYVLNRWKYLTLDQKGIYYTTQYYKNNPVEEGKYQPKPLSDWMVYHHINGKQTLGVFAGKLNNIEVSKFITFDVDVPDKELAKWVVDKIVHVIQDLGIDDEFIHINFSGNKGYHVDMFFDAPIEVNLLHQFYNYVLIEENLTKKEMEIEGYGEVEFRPTYTQGVKIPLGINFRNTNSLTNQCYFCDYGKGLSPIKDPLYITKIKKMDNILFRLILDKIFDDGTDEDVNSKNVSHYKKIKEQNKPLKIYDQNIDEDVTVEAIQTLIETGLTRTGTSHNSILKICKYYKHLEVSKTDCTEWVTEWMDQQDKKFYKTKWEDILKEINEIVDYVYSHNCALVGGVKKVEITYVEVREILKAKSKNEKLTLYSMLIHSKRYATKSGVFYFPYSLMEQATGLTRKTLIKMVNLLEGSKFIEIISRNKGIEHKFMKESNKYKITLNIIQNLDNISDKVFDYNEGDNYIESFNNCLLGWFNNKDIKELCGRRHYEELMDYKDNKCDINV